jgi:hypothetical protein
MNAYSKKIEPLKVADRISWRPNKNDRVKLSISAANLGFSKITDLEKFNTAVGHMVVEPFDDGSIYGARPVEVMTKYVNHLAGHGADKKSTMRIEFVNGYVKSVKYSNEK